jgi:TPR repeat protein
MRQRPRSLRDALLGSAALLAVAGVSWPQAALADFAAGSRAYEKGDYETAYREWLPLARAGDASAQRNIGQLYRLGQGVPKDAAVAVNWYRLAAEQGLARAQANLGVMFITGEGIGRDYAMAALWFQRAAEQGHAISQFNLALLYEQGLGVDKNQTRATSWLQRAAENGHDRAAERLAQVLNDKVAPAAGASAPNRDVAPAAPAVAAKPDPSRPVQTARAGDYLPAWLRERPTRDAKDMPAMPPGDGAARSVEVARAEPPAVQPQRPPTGPSALAGTSEARLALRPAAPREPQLAQMPKGATLPKTVPESPALASLRAPLEKAPPPADKPIPAKLDAAPAPRRVEAQIVVPVPALIKTEAARDAAPQLAAIIVPPSAVVVREAAEDAARQLANSQPAVPDFLKREAVRERPTPAFLIDEAKRDGGATTIRAALSDEWRETETPRPAARPPEPVAPPPVKEPSPAAVDEKRVPRPTEAPTQKDVALGRNDEEPKPDRPAPREVALARSETAPLRDVRTPAPLREDEARAPSPLPAFLKLEAEQRLTADPKERAPAFLRHESEQDRRAVALRSAAPETVPVPAFLRADTAPRRLRPFDEIPVPLFLRAEAELDFVRLRAGASVPPLLQREAMADAASSQPRFSRPNLSDPDAAAVERDRRERIATANVPKPAPAPPSARPADSPENDWVRAVDAGVAAYLTRDYAKALTHWQPAADAGHADAQYFLGGLHLDGLGVPRSLVLAYVWFSRAEAGGHQRAADNLALLRRVMTDVQYAEAVNRFRAGSQSR